MQPTASPGGAEGGAPGVHLDRHHLTALGADDDTRAAVGQERADQSKADDEEHTDKGACVFLLFGVLYFLSLDVDLFFRNLVFLSLLFFGFF